MCLGLGSSCNACGDCVGNILYVTERLATCCMMTAVVCCLVSTLITMLALGIGLGYNYCYVDHQKPLSESIIDWSSTQPTVGTDLIQGPWIGRGGRSNLRKFVKSNNTAASSEFPVTKPVKFLTANSKPIPQINTQSEMPSESFKGFDYSEIKPTMMVPLRNDGLLSLIKKLRQENKNVTLQLLAV